MSCLIPSSVSRGMGAQAHRGCSTCLREHAVAGTVLAAQEQVGVPDAEAAAYLRGVAAGYAQHADPQRVESVRTGPISHAVPVRSTAQVLVDVVAAAHSEFLLGQPLAPFRSCWKLGSRMLVWGWFIGLRGQPTLAGGLPGRRSQMRAKCSITGAVHSGPVGHGGREPGVEGSQLVDCCRDIPRTSAASAAEARGGSLGTAHRSRFGSHERFHRAPCGRTLSSAHPG
jgi:hypothetical protein